MRCSSGRVSCDTSITGGWYVWIIDMGRDEGCSSVRGCERGLYAGSLLSSAVEDRLFVLAMGCLAVGEGGAECVVPHCDMKLNTACHVSKPATGGEA